MKTKITFSKGEILGALVLLALILASYLFYYLYDGHRPPVEDPQMREAEFVAFEAEQERLRDSAEYARAHRWDKQGRYGARDTIPKDSLRKKKAMYEIVRMDLNRCDTDDIKVVPMFGGKRAAALVAYRDKLGGFYALSQLKEVFVLQNLEEDFLEKYFYVRADEVQKIHINSASYADIVKHPYFDAYLTKTILNYRQKSGRINSFEELQRITHAYPELMERLRHYVVFD